MHGAGDVEDVLVAHAEDLHQGGRFSVEPGRDVRFRESVDDPGHVAEEKPRAVGAGPQHDPVEFGSDQGLPLRSEQDLAAGCLHRTAGQVER